MNGLTIVGMLILFVIGYYCLIVLFGGGGRG